MGNLMVSFFVVVLLSSSAGLEQAPSSEQVQIGSKVAEALLVHREEPACQKNSDGVKVTGTVVIAVMIDKSGKVNHTRVFSGPKLLRPLALAAVRKYRYKPYLLNGTPIEVETVVSITMDCTIHTGQA